MYSETTTVWCAIHFEDVLDPYYFNVDPVRKEDFFELLHSYVRNERQKFPENVLFQQDFASEHTSRDVRALLQELFEENWIGKHGPVN